MTDEEMADALRAKGWTVIAPASLTYWRKVNRGKPHPWHVDDGTRMEVGAPWRTTCICGSGIAEHRGLPPGWTLEVSDQPPSREDERCREVRHGEASG